MSDLDDLFRAVKIILQTLPPTSEDGPPIGKRAAARFAKKLTDLYRNNPEVRKRMRQFICEHEKTLRMH